MYSVLYGMPWDKCTYFANQFDIHAALKPDGILAFGLGCHHNIHEALAAILYMLIYCDI